MQTGKRELSGKFRKFNHFTVIHLYNQEKANNHSISRYDIQLNLVLYHNVDILASPK